MNIVREELCLDDHGAVVGSGHEPGTPNPGLPR
jgi:hypothetical protein